MILTTLQVSIGKWTGDCSTARRYKPKAVARPVSSSSFQIVFPVTSLRRSPALIASADHMVEGSRILHSRLSRHTSLSTPHHLNKSKRKPDTFSVPERAVGRDSPRPCCCPEMRPRYLSRTGFSPPRREPCLNQWRPGHRCRYSTDSMAVDW